MSKRYIDVIDSTLNGDPMERIATTLRIDPVVRARLAKLSEHLGRSMNSLADQALKELLAKLTLEVESDLEASLEELRAYRKNDPNFERAIAEAVDAEMTVEHDPAEGHVIEPAGPTEKEVLELLND